ncbi:hypothetical protein H2198_010831 [Neophaeococcomyces mojaviensis]|uniref:Uncharacterized protein n=1 Tax=Neophaeococcomyces mojaviensis TaxID=3383035 RepID=A0ACC2ZQG0_9EURO|nr:hypothetical protein H2198_010831 [Knufia sp. JES_112]
MGKLFITNNASVSEDPEKQQTTLPQSTIPKMPTATKGHGGLSLEQYRALVGIPQEVSNPKSLQTRSQPILPGQNGFIKTPYGFQSLSNTNLTAIHENLPAPIRPATVTTRGLSSHGPRILIFFRLFSRPQFIRHSSPNRKPGRNENPNEALEYATSLYYTLAREESDQWRLYHIYNIITYACLILQLVIASALIIIGAIPVPGSSGSRDTFSGHRIAIAILGAVTGVLTGLMSLLKGQGLPTRLLQYANRLRQVRDKMEFLERALRANVGAIVTYQDVIDLWTEFETVRNEREMNRPDVWTTSTGPTGIGNTLQSTTPAPTQAQTNPSQHQPILPVPPPQTVQAGVPLPGPTPTITSTTQNGSRTTPGSGGAVQGSQR